LSIFAKESHFVQLFEGKTWAKGPSDVVSLHQKIQPLTMAVSGQDIQAFFDLRVIHENRRNGPVFIFRCRFIFFSDGFVRYLSYICMPLRKT